MGEGGWRKPDIQRVGVGKKCIGEEEGREVNRKREWGEGRKGREIRRGGVREEEMCETD